MDNTNNEIIQGNSLNNIKKNKEKKIFNESIMENFSGMSDDNKYLDPGQIILKKQDGVGGPVIKKNLDDFEELKQMKLEYFRVLQKYNGIYDNLMKDTKSYLESVSDKNSNKFKDGMFTNGAYGYITNRGVFKQYANPTAVNNTGGKNNCPSAWSGNSNNLGDEIDSVNTGEFIDIPNNKPLMKGTQMVSGQSCGNEGQNIYVVESSKTSGGNYIGCYNPTGMSYQSDLGNNVSFDQCAQRAEDLGNNYFGLSDKNSSNNGKCFVGGNNSSNTSAGKAYNITETWKYTWSDYSDYNYHQTYAILTNRGVLKFYNEGSEIWSSGSDGPVDHYRITLQNDGNLVIYKSNNSAVWSSRTNGKYGDNGTGPSGRNTIYPGNRFSSMSSSSKNCYFSINSSKAGSWFFRYRKYRFRIKYRKWKCTKLNAPSNSKTRNQWIGYTDGARALYQTTNANRSGVTHVSHITDDGKLSRYPDNYKYYPDGKLSVETSEDQFEKIQGFDSWGNDIVSYPGSVEKAKKDCASRSNCAGFAYSNGRYWLKNSNMYPRGLRQPRSGIDIYVRKPAINNHFSCGKQVNFANNDLYLNYPRKGRDMSLNTLCGLGIISESYKQKLQEAYRDLLKILEKIRLKIIELTSENVNLNKLLMKEYNKMMSDLKKYEEIYKDIRIEKEMDTHIRAMNQDSDIQMISENYSYMLWSILAIFILFGTMKTMKTLKK